MATSQKKQILMAILLGLVLSIAYLLIEDQGQATGASCSCDCVSASGDTLGTVSPGQCQNGQTCWIGNDRGITENCQSSNRTASKRSLLKKILS